MSKSIQIYSESTKNQYLRKSVQQTRYHSTEEWKSYKSWWKIVKNQNIRKLVETTRYQSSRKRNIESKISGNRYCSYNHCMDHFHTTHCFQEHLFCWEEQRNGHRCEKHEEIFDKIPRFQTYQPHELVTNINWNSSIAHN